MQLLVDSRERALMNEMNALLRDNDDNDDNDDDDDDAKEKHRMPLLSFLPSPSLPPPTAAALDLGDIQFVDIIENGKDGDDDNADNSGGIDANSPATTIATTTATCIRVAIERKTVADLCASIKDGRYREQKHRLRGCVAARGGRVVYVVEGHQGGFADLAVAAQAHGLAQGTLKTCVYGLTVSAGIPVMFTRDLRDTACAVLELWQRHHASFVQQQQHRQSYGKDREHMPGGGEERPQQLHAAPSSSSVLIASGISSKRSGNLTPQTCYLLQLCQIPGVSIRTARVMASRWPSMAALYAELSPLDETGRRRALAALDTIGKKGAQIITAHLFFDGVVDRKTGEEDK